MMSRYAVKMLIVFWLACITLLPCYAEKENMPEETYAQIYTRGRISIQFVTGVLFGHRILIQAERPDFDYFPINLRCGWMLNTPGSQKSFFRGNFDALFEVTYSSIFNGPGDYFLGITALIRYNFVQPDAKLIPYAQFGAGVVFTDAHKVLTQNVIGQSIEFTPQISIGFHYSVAENWTFDFEGMFHHVSNAGLAVRNDGLNSFGAFAGFTHFF